MSVNIVEGKDPSLCAARRCQKPAAQEVDGHALCAVHAARMGAAPAAAPAQAGTAITPAVQAQAQEDAATAQADLAELEAFTIESQEDLEFAGELLSQIQGEIKRLEGVMSGLLEPIKESRKRIEALFKPAIKLRKDAKEIVKGKIVKLQLELAERNAVAVEAGNHTAIISTEDAKGFTAVADEWELDTVKVSFAEVPDTYKMLCYGEIQKLCKAHKGLDVAPSVPGLAFKRSARVIAR